MKRLLPYLIALLSASITPLHGDVTIYAGGDQTSGATVTTTISGGTLSLGSSSGYTGSTLQLVAGNLNNTIALRADIAGPNLQSNLTDVSQLLLPLNTLVVNSTVSGGTLNFGGGTLSLVGSNTSSGLIKVGAGGTIQILGNNTYSGTLINISPLTVSPGLLNAGPLLSVYPTLTSASQLLRPLSTGGVLTVSGGTLNLGGGTLSLVGSNTSSALINTGLGGTIRIANPINLTVSGGTISLGSGTLTVLNSGNRLISTGGTLVINNASSFPFIYGATIANEPSLATANNGAVLTAASLIKTGTSLLTLSSGNSANVILNSASTTNTPLIYGATILNGTSSATLNASAGTLTLSSGNGLTAISGLSLSGGLITGSDHLLLVNGSPAPVPEPGSVLLLVSGLGTLFLRRQRMPRG